MSLIILTGIFNKTKNSMRSTITPAYLSELIFQLSDHKHLIMVGCRGLGMLCTFCCISFLHFVPPDCISPNVFCDVVWESMVCFGADWTNASLAYKLILVFSALGKCLFYYVWGGSWKNAEKCKPGPEPRWISSTSLHFSICWQCCQKEEWKLCLVRLVVCTLLCESHISATLHNLKKTLLFSGLTLKLPESSVCSLGKYDGFIVHWMG